MTTLLIKYKSETKEQEGTEKSVLKKGHDAGLAELRYVGR